jgi:hypothetical protein
MNAIRNTALFVILVGIAGVAQTSGREQFTGRVRDIDYGVNQTQVIMSGTSSADELVATVTSDRVQNVLQSGLITGRPTQVRHANHIIQSAKLLSLPTTCSGPGCVEELTCDATSCEARISGHVGQVSTMNRRALGILLTAVNHGTKVSELTTDKKNQITRVKVKVP